jgi:hypothetical protein
MNLTNYYWYFKSAIPERVCDDIIKYGNAQQREQIALTGGQTKKLEELEAKEKAQPKKPKKKKKFQKQLLIYLMTI